MLIIVSGSNNINRRSGLESTNAEVICHKHILTYS